MCGICQAVNPFQNGCSLEVFGAETPRVETVDATDSYLPGVSNYELAVGDSFQGQLTAGDYDVIDIFLTEGASYTVDLTAATDGGTSVRDTYLLIVDDSGAVVAQSDNTDFSVGNYYSSVTFTAGYSGQFRLVATSYDTHIRGGTSDVGGYTLAVSDAAAPGVYSYDEIAEFLTYGGWGNATYAWTLGAGGQLSVDLTRLTAEGQHFARAALQSWEMVLGISFVEVTSGAQISFGDANPGAYASFSISSGTITSANINVSTDWIAGAGTALNTYAMQTYIHEVGHALGLAHAGSYNGSAAYGVDNHYANDSWQASVMSYFHQIENTWLDASFAFVVTPMMADILAAQRLYGVSGTVRADDTVYGVNSTAGGYYDQLGTLNNIAFTILDDGGIDTFDASSYSGTQRVDLNAETFSDVFGETGNFGIARGTVIENFIGGSGRDTVFGNAAANEISGRAGDDRLYGGAGNDRLLGGDGADRLFGNAGNDRLWGGAGDDELRGNSGSNELFGGAGNDLLIGGHAGDDQLFGEAGSDILSGRGGADILAGGDGFDFAYGGAGADTLEGGAGEDRLRGHAGNDMLSGGDGLDRLYGGTGADSLFGGAGRDFLLGDAGDDLLDGGAGNDNLTGGAGRDTFVFRDLGYGYDRLLDFIPGFDMIDLTDFALTGLAEVTARMSDTVHGLRIDFGDGDVLMLLGLSGAELGASDFLI